MLVNRHISRTLLEPDSRKD